MRMPEPATVASAAALVGALLVVLGTGLAVRRRSAAGSFAWAVIAAAACALLCLAAELRAPDSGGLRAAVFQLLTTLLAATLGGMAFAGAGEARAERSGLAAAARGAAWLSLVGLPPTVGFHGRILIYRCLLAAGWPWLTVLAMAASAVAMLPALRGLGAGQTGRVRALPGFAMAVLVILTCLLGLWPQAGLAVSEWVANRAMPA